MSESSLSAVKLRMRTFLLLTLLLVGCQKINSGYCPGGDCALPCTESGPDCICVDMVCVECTADDETNCGGTRPQCGADNVCRACSSNADCNDSDACLEDGSCAAASQVIYAAPNGVETGDCGQTTECSLTRAHALVSASRNVIRLAPGDYEVPGTLDGLDFSLKSATLVARGATLTRATAAATSGPIISVRNGQTFKLVGGTLLGPSFTTDGIKCIDNNSKLFVHEVTIDDMTQSGIETDLCQLTVARSTLRNNGLGGINMVSASVATVTNNFVYRNGSAASPIGGMGLKLATGSKLQFNTVVDNNADTSIQTAGGIVCDTQSYDAPFNLVYRNVGGLGTQVQVIGSCTFVGSYQQGAGPGENAVGFETPAGTIPSYRLTGASPTGTIRDAVDCNDIDFEGQARPFPAGGKCDYGADEYREGQ